MGIFGSLWLLFAGFVASRDDLRSRVPALVPAYTALEPGRPGVGVASTVLAAVFGVSTIVGFFGLLGLEFAMGAWIRMGLWALSVPALGVIGFSLGGDRLAEIVPTSGQTRLVRAVKLWAQPKLKAAGFVSMALGLALTIF